MILTTEQRQIQKHGQGVALIQAGPGCGKTQTLIMVIKNIFRPGIKPRAKKVLVLTYNKSTASDFKIRLEKEETSVDHIDVMTFHAFGKSVIQENWSLLGFASAPVVKTDNYRPDKLINRVAKKHGIKNRDLKKAFYTHLNGGSTIEVAKLEKALSELLKLHQKHKLRRGIIDFDDMQRLVYFS